MSGRGWKEGRAVVGVVVVVVGEDGNRRGERLKKIGRKMKASAGRGRVG